MKSIRKPMLAIAASAALAATIIACAQEVRHQAPTAAPVSPAAVSPAAVSPAAVSPAHMSNLPPVYFGPAYSAAVVYSQIRKSKSAPD